MPPLNAGRTLAFYPFEGYDGELDNTHRNEPRQIIIGERPWSRAVALRRALGLRYRFRLPRPGRPGLLLMATMEHAQGAAMHAVRASSDSPLEHRRAVEELITTVWRVYIARSQRGAA